VSEPRDPLKSSFDRKYRIERQVGRGGMANVFLARDLKHDRPVALKVLKPEVASVVGGGERFLREIRTVARLHHPHILTLHDSGSLDGALYYVMPFVEGESLRDRLERDGRVPLETALRIAREAADALAYAHRQGVVHRDIKPENILLAGEHAIVADFGIARAIQITAGDRLTDSGFVLGTPAYMSPEQASGSSEIDGRSDVYSLGVTLYEMLTGARPTPSAGARLLDGAARPTPPEGRGDLPAAVRPVLAKAIAPAPEARYATAAELRDALDELLPRRGRGAGAWLQSHGVMSAAAAGALTLVLLAVGAVLRRGRGDVLSEAAGQRVAVTPFDVPDRNQALAGWSTHFAYLLGGGLDHVAGLRPVALKATIDRWGGPGEHPTPQEMGRRLSARFVVTGTLASAGPDSVRALLTVYDIAGDRIERIERTSAADQMPDLVHASAIGVLEALGQWRPIGAVRGAPIAITRNLEALQEFVAGEQAFRESDWQSALEHHQSALARDSGLAVSRRRIGMIKGWRRHTDDSASIAWKLSAGALNHGQAARDSFLLLADSLGAALEVVDADTLKWRLTRRLLATLTRARDDYSEDAEVWYELGDARYHHGSTLNGVSQRGILDAFDAAIELDSAFTPAYIHAVELGFSLGGRALGERYARAYLARSPTDVHARGIELAVRLLEAGGPGTEAGRRLLDTTDFDTKYTTWAALSNWPDSAEAAVALVRAMDAQVPLDTARGGAATPARPPRPRLRTVQQLALRGHLREAAAGLGAILAARPDRHEAYPLLADLALLGAVPADSASQAFARVMASGNVRRATFALPLWSRRRDTTLISAFAAAAARAGDSVPRYVASYAVAAAGAHLALARADTSDALARFDALPDTLCLDCRLDRLVHARLLIARGRHDDAARVLDEPFNNLPGAELVLYAFERGRAAELRGDRDEARRWYRFVSDAWASADGERSAFVDSARAGVRRSSAR